MNKLIAAIVMVLSLSLAFAGVSFGAEKTVDPKTLENRNACIAYVKTLPMNDELSMYMGGMSEKGCCYSKIEACKALFATEDREGMVLVGKAGTARMTQLRRAK